MAEPSELLEKLTSGDSETAEAAAVALQQFGPSALLSLAKLVQSPDSDKRWWALRALSEFDTQNAQQHFLNALTDVDTAVRQCAALGLAKRPIAEAIQPLIQALSDEDPMVARLAGDALVAIGGEAVPALMQKAEQSHASAQAESTRALALIGDTKAIPTLFKLLEAPSAIVEHWASQGLENMGVGMSFFQMQ